MHLTLIGLMAGVCASVVLFGCTDRQVEAQAELASAQAKLDRNSEKYLVEMVKEGLKDPGSAQFRNTTLYRTFIITEKGSKRQVNAWALCGEVNAKNGYGGYTGFRPFVAAVSFSSKTEKKADEFVSLAPDSEPPSPTTKVFVQHYKEFCTDRTM